MDLSKLQVLKQRLVNEKDFRKVWGYFLDEFATNMAFIDLGESIHHEMLEQAIAQLGVQMFPQPPKAIMLRLIHLPDQKFIHGNVNVDGRVGGMLFFEDVGVGLVAVSEHFPSDETKFARFSTRPARPGAEPSRN